MRDLHSPRGILEEIIMPARSSNPLRLIEVTTPELEKPENARWLALLLDTEGSLGWTRRIQRRNRIDGYRYLYRYANPYLSVEMNELQSRETVEEGARLVGVIPRTRIHGATRERTRYFTATTGRAIETMRHVKPHLVKFRRLTELCLALFRHHTYIRLDQFDRIIKTLFDIDATPKEANEILLTLSASEYERLLNRADKLAPK